MTFSFKIAKRLLLALVLLGAALSCSPKLVDVVKTYEQAYNDRDLDALLALFAADVHFEIAGQVDLRGKDQLKSLAEYDFALNVEMSIDQYETRDDTVMCQLLERNDWLRTAGIPEARYMARFKIEDGLIRTISAEQTPETAADFKKVLGSLMRWAEQERSATLAEMMPEGKFAYNGENAVKSLSLLRQWKEVVRKQSAAPQWRKLGE
jgi:hypothetical protein